MNGPLIMGEKVVNIDDAGAHKTNKDVMCAVDDECVVLE